MRAIPITTTTIITIITISLFNKRYLAMNPFHHLA